MATPRVKEATWEREDTIRTNYPFLFQDKGIFFSYESPLIVDTVGKYLEQFGAPRLTGWLCVVLAALSAARTTHNGKRRTPEGVPGLANVFPNGI